MKSFFQHDLQIVFHTWVTKFVHLQFLRLGTFPLGVRLEGKGDFAAYQPMISVAYHPMISVALYCAYLSSFKRI